MRYELLGMYTLMTVYVNYTVLSNSQTNPYNFGFKGKEAVVCLGRSCADLRRNFPGTKGKGVCYEPWDQENSLRYDSTDRSSVI